MVSETIVRNRTALSVLAMAGVFFACTPNFADRNIFPLATGAVADGATVRQEMLEEYAFECIRLDCPAEAIARVETSGIARTPRVEGLLGYLYAADGKKDRARGYIAQAAASDQYAVRRFAALGYLELNDPDAAIGTLAAVLDPKTIPPDGLYAKGQALAVLGHCYRKKKDYARATVCYVNAERLLTLNLKDDEAEIRKRGIETGDVLVNRGWMYLEQNDGDAALYCARLAQDNYVSAGRPGLGWEAELLKFKTNIGRKNTGDAFADGRDGLALIEAYRRDVPPELRKGLYRHHVTLASEIVTAGADDEKYGAEAFYAAESVKARQLVEMLSEVSQKRDTAAETEKRDVYAKLKENEAALVKKLHAGATDGTRGSELKRLKNVRAEIKKVRTETDARRGSVFYPSPAQLAEIRAKIAPDEVMLYYFTTGEQQTGGGATFAWAITANGVTFKKLGSTPEIEAAVRRYLELIASPLAGTIAEHKTIGYGLYEKLLKPFEDVIAAKPKLIVVPDGLLSFLPFEALIEKPVPADVDVFGRFDYLVKSRQVRYVFSGDTFIYMKARAKSPGQWGKQLLALGNPSYEAASGQQGATNERLRSFATRSGGLEALPHAEEEVNTLGKLMGSDESKILTGAEAAESTLKGKQLTDYRFLHFAVHGVLSTDLDYVSEPSLVLSLDDKDAGSDGFLEMSEIFNLKLDAELVTLSACSTGLGKVYRGEGVEGLPRALMYAGARSVCVSMWNVDDYATCTMMQRFYLGLRQGKDRAEALVEAKRFMLGKHGMHSGMDTRSIKVTGKKDGPDVAHEALTTDPKKGAAPAHRTEPDVTDGEPDDRAKTGLPPNLQGHPFTWAAFVYIGD